MAAAAAAPMAAPAPRLGLQDKQSKDDHEDDHEENKPRKKPWGGKFSRAFRAKTVARQCDAMQQCTDDDDVLVMGKATFPRRSTATTGITTRSAAAVARAAAARIRAWRCSRTRTCSGAPCSTLAAPPASSPSTWRAISVPRPFSALILTPRYAWSCGPIVALLLTWPLQLVADARKRLGDAKTAFDREREQWIDGRWDEARVLAEPVGDEGQTLGDVLEAKRARFPAAFRHLFGPLTPTAVARPAAETCAFPFNVRFREENFVQAEAVSNRERGSFDTISCLSVTKWVQLNWGDDAVKLLFRKVHSLLKDGGVFLAEFQPWKSYRREYCKTETMRFNLDNIKMRPSQYVRRRHARSRHLALRLLTPYRPTSYAEYLESIGLEKVTTLGPPPAATQGFRRPLHVFRKRAQPATAE